MFNNFRSILDSAKEKISEQLTIQEGTEHRKYTDIVFFNRKTQYHKDGLIFTDRLNSVPIKNVLGCAKKIVKLCKKAKLSIVYNKDKCKQPRCLLMAEWKRETWYKKSGLDNFSNILTRDHEMAQ